ncbi:MAG: AAA family ATPase [Acidobacteria bacterium]|nr:AAA family ATPase [Acidobacteriota bacterium]
MTLAIQRATKAKSKLRLALFGPSGSGKTFSALRIATGMVQGGKVLVLDTEAGSASLYADRFAFDTILLNEFPDIDQITEGIGLAASGGYGVLIIDSMTHAWRELLAQVDRLSNTTYRGNKMGGWIEGTPKQQKFIRTLLLAPLHVIATMRVKTEWVMEANDKGKIVPRRVGLAPEQGKGIEYEFGVLGRMTEDHVLTIIKDRTGKFQDVTIDKPGEDFGKALAAWLAEGVDAPLPVPALPPVKVDLAMLAAMIDECGIPEERQERWLKRFNVTALTELTQPQVDQIIEGVKKTLKESEA